MALTLYPYNVLPNGIAVTVKKVGVAATRSGNTLSLYDPSPSTPFQLDITALVSADWVKLIPPDERKSPPVKMVASVVGIESRVRLSEELTKTGGDTFHGILTLDPARFTGEIDLQLALIRTAPAATRRNGLASDRVARLTWSEEQRILLSPPKPAHGSFLKVEWLDLTSASGDLAKFSRSLFYFDKSGSAPRLLLNQAASNQLYQLMDVGGHGHDKALARDTVFSFIAASVMQTVLVDIVCDLYEQSQNSPPADLDNLLEWQSKFIKDIASDLYPEFPEDDALREFLERVCDSAERDELLRTRIPLACQVDRHNKSICEKLAERLHDNG
jgi:hypothetical protein